MRGSVDRSKLKNGGEMVLDDEISKNVASYDVTITWRYPGESQKYSNVYGLNQ